VSVPRAAAAHRKTDAPVPREGLRPNAGCATQPSLRNRSVMARYTTEYDSSGQHHSVIGPSRRMVFSFGRFGVPCTPHSLSDGKISRPPCRQTIRSRPGDLPGCATRDQKKRPCQSP